MGKADRVKEAAVEAVWSEAMDERGRQRAIAGAQTLGAAKAVLKIGHALTISSLRRLRQFIDDEEYKDLGHQTVVEFFASGEAGITKNQYYDRIAALDREGESVFDLLNSTDVPLSHRKLLTEGEIRIEGEEVIVGGEESEQRVPITDRLTLKSLIASIAEKKSNAERRVAQLEKKLKQGERDFEKLKRQAPQPVHTDATSHGQALLTLDGAYCKLRDAVMVYAEAVEPGSEADQEFHRFHKKVIDLIGARYMELSDAFGITEPRDAGADDLDLDGVDAAELLEN